MHFDRACNHSGAADRYSHMGRDANSVPHARAHLFHDPLESASHTIWQATGDVSSETAHSHLIDDQVLEWQVWPLVALSPVKRFAVKVVRTIELAANLFAVSGTHTGVDIYHMRVPHQHKRLKPEAYASLSARTILLRDRNASLGFFVWNVQVAGTGMNTMLLFICSVLASSQPNESFMLWAVSYIKLMCSKKLFRVITHYVCLNWILCGSKHPLNPTMHNPVIKRRDLPAATTQPNQLAKQTQTAACCDVIEASLLHTPNWPHTSTLKNSSCHTHFGLEIFNAVALSKLLASLDQGRIRIQHYSGGVEAIAWARNLVAIQHALAREAFHCYVPDVACMWYASPVDTALHQSC